MDLRYPIGRFTWSGVNTPGQRAHLIDEIAATPERLRAAVTDLTVAQLETPYREGGWSVRQVVHHIPDSHLHSYIRFKLALTEEQPTIKPYNESRWAELTDARTGPVETSLGLLEQLHERWVLLLRALSPDDFARTFQHPERGIVSLDANLAMYAWHGAHHVAHIESLRQRLGWR